MSLSTAISKREIFFRRRNQQAKSPLNVTDPELVKEVHDDYRDVGARILTMIQQGKGYSEVVAAATTKEFDAKWGQPDQFVTETFKGIMRNLHDVGVIRG